MQRARRLRASPATAALLALALLWAQTLGLLHRVQHAPIVVAPASAMASPADDGQAVGRWGHDRQSESCKLYDQLALGDAAAGVAPAVALPHADAVVSSETATPSTRDARLAYRARAPPLNLG